MSGTTSIQEKELTINLDLCALRGNNNPSNTEHSGICPERCRGDRYLNFRELEHKIPKFNVFLLL